MAIVLATIGVLTATAFGRRIWGRLRLNVSKMVGELRQLARQPGRLGVLLGGAFTAKLIWILAFAATMRAFGVPVNLPAVGAMYLTATTVAAAAPTPGGVGAIEAALVAGLTGLGEAAGDAAAIVLVFRLFTYWLPTLPCWIALGRLERSGDA